MVQVVQNQFIPPSDNVDALYLELQRCLIYSGIVSNLEEKVGRIRDAIYEHGPYAEGDVEHRVQCATQGLAWCILETNMLDSVTRIQYGGLSTFGSMREEHHNVARLDRVPWTLPSLEAIFCEALCDTVLQQEHFRTSMPAVYGMLVEPGLAFPRTCPVPMDLFRKDHTLGMFSTLVNFVRHAGPIPESISFRMQSYTNIVWTISA
jgi:hypothetical protein